MIKNILPKLRTVLILLLFLLVLAPPWPAFGDEQYLIETAVSQRQFDFLVWEVNAFRVKLEGLFSGGQRFVEEGERSQFVVDYLDLLTEIQRLDGEIRAIYVDPDVADPDAASELLQQEYDEKRAALAEKRPLAEAIIQDQVGAVLVEQGFGIGGTAYPPVVMHMTPLPTVLMVSPRDRIERLHSVVLKTDVTVPEFEQMETAVYAEANLSALVVPIGGLGTFPAMIQETSSINWLVEVTVHEWSHIWMAPYPVGVNYTLDNDVRVINETAASIIDQEVRDIVIATHYPDFVLPPPPENPPLPPQPDPDAPPPFNFRAEMAETRNEVDRLLSLGMIDEAEAYMDERRLFFVENGYNIRKINQAYFAFYGAYAAQPGGAAGQADPIGPAVRELRALSPTLRNFMDDLAQVGSFVDLEQLLETKR